MKIENVCTVKRYEKNGEKKTIWLPVGRLKTLDNGKKFLELCMFPDTDFYVFEDKKKEEPGDVDGGGF